MIRERTRNNKLNCYKLWFCLRYKQFKTSTNFSNFPGLNRFNYVHKLGYHIINFLLSGLCVLSEHLDMLPLNKLLMYFIIPKVSHFQCVFDLATMGVGEACDFYKDIFYFNDWVLYY